MLEKRINPKILAGIKSYIIVSSFAIIIVFAGLVTPDSYFRTINIGFIIGGLIFVGVLAFRIHRWNKFRNDHEMATAKITKRQIEEWKDSHGRVNKKYYISLEFAHASQHTALRAIVTGKLYFRIGDQETWPVFCASYDPRVALLDGEDARFSRYQGENRLIVAPRVASRFSLIVAPRVALFFSRKLRDSSAVVQAEVLIHYKDEVTVRFKAHYQGEPREYVLDAKIKKELFYRLGEGMKVKVRYATEDPRIMLLEGEKGFDNSGWQQTKESGVEDKEERIKPDFLNALTNFLKPNYVWDIKNTRLRGLIRMIGGILFTALLVMLTAGVFFLLVINSPEPEPGEPFFDLVEIILVGVPLMLTLLTFAHFTRGFVELLTNKTWNKATSLVRWLTIIFVGILLIMIAAIIFIAVVPFESWRSLI